jgi:hypothetical protein
MSVPLLGQESYLVVVRRGEGPLFLALQRFLEPLPHVDVIWDRRRADRRAGEASIEQERRGADRRLTNVEGPVLAHLVRHAPAA